MNPHEVLSFLLPQFSDILQLAFFSIILFMIGLTVVSAHRTARAASWEHKWNRGTPDDPSDDLDIEHGSVTDLWHAVATAPEKLAEIMPGMLLVVGLLGTFLGLGLALNHASSILSQSDLSNAGAAADSMQNLLGLLQGLGTKFKTSTWGILGFVLLKIWGEVTRFEEKRLAWVIGKVKAELEYRKRAQVAAEAAKQEALFGSIGQAAAGIVTGMAAQMEALIQSNRTMHQQTLQGHQDMLAELTSVREEMQGTRVAMFEFTEGTRQVVEGMGGAAQRMADGADKVGAGAAQLVAAIGTFETQFTEVLDRVGADLGTAIQDMSAQAGETLERGSAELGAATREISRALEVLSVDTRETMNEVKQSIEKSLTIQEVTSRKFTETSMVLNEKIHETKGIVELMGKSIEAGLASIATANRQMRTVAADVATASEHMVAVVAELKDFSEGLKPLPDIVEVQRATVELLRAARRATPEAQAAPTAASADRPDAHQP